MDYKLGRGRRDTNRLKYETFKIKEVKNNKFITRELATSKVVVAENKVAVSGLIKGAEFTAVKFYDNVGKLKSTILAENKGKSGIYYIINKINGKTYVGSGQDLAKRLALYFKHSELRRFKRPIHSALLKYGHENFKLEILEYVYSKQDLIKREQFYINELTPEYNILKIAYSLAGYKHTDETKAHHPTPKGLDERGVPVTV